MYVSAQHIILLITLLRISLHYLCLRTDFRSSAIREWCLAVHDVRASVVEVVSRWNELRHMGGLPKHEQQSIAIVALQVHAPLGHALGLGPISAALEDLCFQVREGHCLKCTWSDTVDVHNN